MQINTKYDMGQKIWAIGRYDMKPKVCSCCGNHMQIIRYRVLPKTKIYRISITALAHLGDIIRYEDNKGSHAEESRIDCAGGVWFTTPEAAQSECDRRNNEAKGVARE